MSVLTVIGCFFIWLLIFALVLRFVIGGIIDIFKKGSAASIWSWMGFAIGLIVGLIVTAAILE